MHILITGAGNGIGAALLKIWQSETKDIFSVIDRDPRSEELRSDRIKVQIADLSSPEAVPDYLKKAEADSGPVDVLVNNAGIMWLRNMTDTSWADFEKLVNLDYLTPIRLMHAVLPGMMERQRGGVINVSSMAAVTPIPGSSAYSGAKAALAIASEIVRREVRSSGVHVLTVYPGPVRTDLEKQVRQQVQQGGLADSLPMAEPDAIARRIFQAWNERRKRLVYPDFYEAFRLLPGVNAFFTERFAPEPVK